MRCETMRNAASGLALAAWCFCVQAEGLTKPQIDYMLHCQGCHLPDGAGTPGKVPALKQAVGQFLRVSGGREYLIQVPGTAQSALSDAEVAGVLNWILQNFSKGQLPPDFVPYSPDEITRFRRQPLADVSSVRSGLLAKIATIRPQGHQP